MKPFENINFTNMGLPPGWRVELRHVLNLYKDDVLIGLWNAEGFNFHVPIKDSKELKELSAIILRVEKYVDWQNDVNKFPLAHGFTWNGMSKNNIYIIKNPETNLSYEISIGESKRLEACVSAWHALNGKGPYLPRGFRFCSKEEADQNKRQAISWKFNIDGTWMGPEKIDPWYWTFTGDANWYRFAVPIDDKIEPEEKKEESNKLNESSFKLPELKPGYKFVTSTFAKIECKLQRPVYAWVFNVTSGEWDNITVHKHFPFDSLPETNFNKFAVLKRAPQQGDDIGLEWYDCSADFAERRGDFSQWTISGTAWLRMDSGYNKDISYKCKYRSLICPDNFNKKD